MRVGSWVWAAASRRGRAHELGGERRQDVQRVQASQGSSLLVAVACDGAGSASHGALGAALSARVLTACTQAHFACSTQMPCDDQIAGWFDIVRQTIADAAAKRSLSPSDFASTAVMALSDASCTITAHVGDGAVVARVAGLDDYEPLRWRALSWPDHGEYVSTTFFVTDTVMRLRVASHAIAFDRLVLMTDGLERLALDFADLVPHAPFLDGLCSPLALGGKGGCDRALSQLLSQYLDTDMVNDRTDDDKTLILAAFG